MKNRKWASSKQPPEVFYQKCALKIFVKLTKKRKPEQFSCGFCETFKNTFFTEHLRETSSTISRSDSNSLIREKYSRSCETAMMEIF